MLEVTKGEGRGMGSYCLILSLFGVVKSFGNGGDSCTTL